MLENSRKVFSYLRAKISAVEFKFGLRRFEGEGIIELRNFGWPMQLKSRDISPFFFGFYVKKS